MTDEFAELLGAAASSPARPAAPPAAAAVPPPAGGESAMGVHEAADRSNSALALWAPPIQSVDADILPEKPIIDARARSIMRDDAFVQGGANIHKDNIVGAHYLLNARPASRVLFGKQDDVWEEEFQEEVEEKWELYADSPDCWVDAARMNNFTAHVRMVVGIHLMAGEMLAAVEWVKDDGAPFSTAIQMIELDRLSTRQDDVVSMMDRNVRGGVRFNRRGAPVAYQIRTSHLNDYGPIGFELPTWKEVPARKPWGRVQMIHLFESIRPEQTRGITELAAALPAMKKTHVWRDVNIQHAVTQSLYAAAITSERPPSEVFAALGGGQINPDAMQAAISAYAEGYLGSIAKYAGNAAALQIDGVRIPHLYPGTKLELLSPGKGGPLGTAFEQSLLRYIAAAVGVSYEQLSRDYTNTNYSSARAAMLETWKFMQGRKKLIADRFATILFRLWLEEAIGKGEISTFPKAKAATLYSGPIERGGRLNLAFDAISRCEWIGASRGQIDESKETDAAISRINAGLSTAEDELARLGKDWRKVYRQIRREQAMREALKLVLPGLAGKSAAAEAPAADNDGDDRPADTKKKEAA